MSNKNISFSNWTHNLNWALHEGDFQNIDFKTLLESFQQEITEAQEYFINLQIKTPTQMQASNFLVKLSSYAAAIERYQKTKKLSPRDTTLLILTAFLILASLLLALTLITVTMPISPIMAGVAALLTGIMAIAIGIRKLYLIPNAKNTLDNIRNALDEDKDHINLNFNSLFANRPNSPTEIDLIVKDKKDEEESENSYEYD